MATKKQKERKKKNRESKAKARVESRRHKLRQVMRDEGRAKKLDIKFGDKMKPFVKDPEKRAEIEATEKEKARQRLERNMQILKALEEEYEAEQQKKKEFNLELEAEGHETLKEKLNAIETAAREIQAENTQENKI